jgi:hypothetical protein
MHRRQRQRRSVPAGVAAMEMVVEAGPREGHQNLQQTPAPRQQRIHCRGTVQVRFKRGMGAGSTMPQRSEGRAKCAACSVVKGKAGKVPCVWQRRQPHGSDVTAGMRALTQRVVQAQRVA